MDDRGIPPSSPQRASVFPEPRARSPEPVSPDAPPPFGGSWNALYAAVAGTLAALIVLFALFTTAFE
jgi:hypothetical protein